MSKKIILASASPRRKELLELAGVKFEIQVPDVDETPLPNEDPKKMVKRLAELKAKVVSRNFSNQKSMTIILAADTTVVNRHKKILGKPSNSKEAVEMILSLQGSVHRVFTGYAIFCVKNGKIVRKRVRAIETKVFIRAMAPVEAKNYVLRGESLDKAGAYAAQGFGMAIIEKINGSYTNVVGLPISEVLVDLKSVGYRA